MGKVFIYTIAGLMAVLLLFMLSLALGSVSIPIQDIIAILLGKERGWQILHIVILLWNPVFLRLLRHF